MKLFKKLLPKAEIRTYTGKVIDIFNLDPDQVCIEDIAHSLAMQCRFLGYTREFYSVAQHSVLCSYICTQTATFEALMHDAAEAYLADVVKPLKRRLPIYRFLERRISKVLSKKFGFTYPFPPGVKEVDRYMLGHEWYALMLNDIPLECWEPKRAEKEFLKTFYGLWKPNS